MEEKTYTERFEELSKEYLKFKKPNCNNCDYYHSDYENCGGCKDNMCFEYRNRVRQDIIDNLEKLQDEIKANGCGNPIIINHKYWEENGGKSSSTCGKYNFCPTCQSIDKQIDEVLK